LLIVQIQPGTRTFQPGTNLVQGDFCYQFAPNTQSVQAYFTLVTNSCLDSAPSNSMAPCPVMPACPLAFRDVQSGHKFYNEIMSMAALNAVTGYEDGTFRPDEKMTRGQAVKALVQAFAIPRDTGSEANSVAHFSDVPQGSPYFEYIEAAYRAGLVSGYKDGTFKPEQVITRGAVVKLAVEAAGWELVKPLQPTFTDVSANSLLYLYVETAASHGILDDVASPGDSFQADKAATRGESAAMIIRARPSPTSDLPESLEALLGKLLESKSHS
jgi:hypothetical protein